MSDDDEKQIFKMVVRGKSKETIIFLALELEAKQSGRFLVPLSDQDGYGFILFKNSGSEFVSVFDIRNNKRLSIRGSAIRIVSEGPMGCCLEFRYFTKDWPKIEPDFLALKKVLNWEGGPELLTGIKKDIGKKKGRGGRRPFGTPEEYAQLWIKWIESSRDWICLEQFLDENRLNGHWLSRDCFYEWGAKLKDMGLIDY